MRMYSGYHPFVCIIYFCALFFFFNDTATTEIYTLSLHDALPISGARRVRDPGQEGRRSATHRRGLRRRAAGDRKSTRLNSSHGYISYAVFCLKKKKKKTISSHTPPIAVTHTMLTSEPTALTTSI